MTAITRKQLELAALAYGIDESWIGNAAYMDGMLSTWRPHLDDGDAARLAVRLRMRVEFDNDSGPGYSVAEQYIDDIREHGFRVKHDGTETDKLRAWREAVVLCAAAVGEQMKARLVAVAG